MYSEQVIFGKRTQTSPQIMLLTQQKKSIMFKNIHFKHFFKRIFIYIVVIIIIIIIIYMLPKGRSVIYSRALLFRNKSVKYCNQSELSIQQSCVIKPVKNSL